MLKVRSILAPIDFSPGSLAALGYAAALARAQKAELTVLFVSDPADVLADLREFTSPAHMMNLLEQDGRLKQVKHQCLIREGMVVDGILQQQAGQAAGLIVMGTMGAGTLKRKIFGTNTMRVIARAPCPVLVIPEGAEYGDIKKVAVATDLSGGDLEVVQESVDLVRPMNPELMFLFVDLTTREKAQTTYRMKEVSPQIMKYVDYPNISFYVSTHRDLYAGLSTFARESKADMLMMVTHARNFATALISPSKTRHMANKSGLPLLAVPLA